jgi:chemotaxis protein MotB
MNSLARRRRSLDIWPGFVDALSSLILVMVFVLLLFAIGQFVLSQTIAGKNEAPTAMRRNRNSTPSTPKQQSSMPISPR